MNSKLLAVAVAGMLAAPAFAETSIPVRRREDYPMPKLGGMGWGGKERSHRMKRNRIEAYKRQRAANRLRRKLEARRG